MSRTKKQPYTKSKAVDKTCRNHGSCPHCINNRKHKKKKQEPEYLMESFGEEYEVSLDYQKPDGYWVVGHRETVVVPLAAGEKEKESHDKAKALAQAKFQGCRINGVTYC